MQIFPETQDQWVFSDDVTAAILVSKQWKGGHVGVPNKSCGS